jgi:LPS-assembly lipoprotein
MSSSDRLAGPAPKKALALVLALASALALAGCFRPMYASVSPTTGQTLDTTLASVVINPVSGRVAQQVRNNLDFDITGGGVRPEARYTLSLTVSSSRYSSIINVQTNEPQVDTVVVTADFALTPVGGKAPALTGHNFANKSYDRTLQRFAALRAARDAENSASETVADQIRTRIAAYLAQHP